MNLKARILRLGRQQNSKTGGPISIDVLDRVVHRAPATSCQRRHHHSAENHGGPERTCGQPGARRRQRIGSWC